MKGGPGGPPELIMINDSFEEIRALRKVRSRWYE